MDQLVQFFAIWYTFLDKSWTSSSGEGGRMTEAVAPEKYKVRSWVDISITAEGEEVGNIMSTSEASEVESDLEKWGPVTPEPSMSEIEPPNPKQHSTLRSP